MRKMLGALVTSAALFAAVGVAHANRSIQMSGNRITASGRQTIADRTFMLFRIECEITKTMTLNRAIAKDAGAVIGGLTAISARSCVGGNITFLTEGLPWPVVYVAYNGTLPRITSLPIEIQNIAFLIESGARLFLCLYAGNTAATLIDSVIRELQINPTIDVPLIGQLRGALMGCPREASLSSVLMRVTGEVQMRLA